MRALVAAQAHGALGVEEEGARRARLDAVVRGVGGAAPQVPVVNPLHAQTTCNAG